ncbi:MAG: response regulator [Deltaproteobacteria bacterium]|nr:response regulator [Deltaproteobacteria bacterium]
MAHNILIVDDSTIVRKSLRKALALLAIDLGEVFEASNGKEALEVVSKHALDLVFLDLNMPIMTGMEFIKIVRDDKLLDNTPIVILSTEGSEIRSRELAQLGVAKQLRKPARPEALTEVITDIFDEGKE